MNKKILTLMLLISFLGIMDSAYLTYIHYYESGHGICELVGNFECDIVNKSIYSEIDGILTLTGVYINLPIPVALLGGLFFIVLFAIQLSLYLGKPFFGLSVKERVMFLFILAPIGLSFGAFLIYIQAFILRAWCLFCLILDLVLFSNLILSFVLYRTSSRQKHF